MIKLKAESLEEIIELKDNLLNKEKKILAEMEKEFIRCNNFLNDFKLKTGNLELMILEVDLLAQETKVLHNKFENNTLNSPDVISSFKDCEDSVHRLQKIADNIQSMINPSKFKT